MHLHGTVPTAPTWLVIQRNGTAIASTAVAGLTWTAGSTFNLAMDTTGSTTTTIRAKLWTGGAAEPASWQLSTTDATPALQVAGAPTVYSYRSGTATGTNLASFDDFTLKNLGAVVPDPEPEPEPHQRRTGGRLLGDRDGVDGQRRRHRVDGFGRHHRFLRLELRRRNDGIGPQRAPAPTPQPEPTP